jgi:hypothetical protein
MRTAHASTTRSISSYAPAPAAAASIAAEEEVKPLTRPFALYGTAHG